MISLAQIIAWTDKHRPAIKKNARKVTVKIDRRKDVFFGNDEDGDKFLGVNAECKGDTITRHVHLRIYGNAGRRSKVWCSCTCEYWLYHCEQAVFQTKVGRGRSTDNQYADFSKRSKDPEVQVNPRLIPHVCKHIYACLELNKVYLQEPVAKPQRKSRRSK